MNRRNRLGGLAALAVAAIVFVPGAQGFDSAATRADLTGNWDVSISTPQRDIDVTFELEQHDDGTLTGSIVGEQGAAPLDDGWVKDDAFGFSVTRDFGGQSVTIEYEGTVAGDELTGQLTAGGGQFTADFTGERAGSQK